MEVELIAYTPKPLNVMYGAARTCYSPLTPQELFGETEALDDVKMITFIDKVLSSGHTSIAEHVLFTFAINGISRACSHQIVRHRHCSFSQQSQRYVSFGDNLEVIKPLPIYNNDVLSKKFDDIIESIKSFSKEAKEAGIKAEDIRSLYPNGSTTNIVLSCNLRELMFIASKRLCKRAQGEVRLLVNLMTNKVVAELPYLNKYLQPQCEILGYCPEHNCCGRKEKLK